MVNITYYEQSQRDTHRQAFGYEAHYDGDAAHQ